jgi:hypothetical protein
MKLSKYDKERNALIPMAVLFANLQAGEEEPKDKTQREMWAVQWNQAYHLEMSRLWKARIR